MRKRPNERRARVRGRPQMHLQRVLLGWSVRPGRQLRGHDLLRQQPLYRRHLFREPVRVLANPEDLRRRQPVHDGLVQRRHRRLCLLAQLGVM